MGNLQLMLITVGVIIVGAAVAFGIQMLSSNAEAANIDHTSVELVRIINKAQEYYAKPTSLGGGGRAFTGFSIPARVETTENAYYTISATTAQSITLLATCRTAEGVIIEAFVSPKSHTMVVN